MQLIKIDNICVKYDDVEVLKGASFDIFEGDFIGVIGPNGGGKTTLVKAILGLVKPHKGSIVKCCNDLKIGYLPQTTTIDKSFPISVLDVVCSGVNRPFRQVRNQAKELLKVAGVEHIGRMQIGKLSGGQLQRVLLCRAMIQNPKVIILDEPTTYVDANFEQNFYEIIHRINNEAVAVVMVSHDLGMVTQHVKTIACVNNSFHYHKSNIIDQHQLNLYQCDLKLVSHGDVPHTVLCNHK